MNAKGIFKNISNVYRELFRYSKKICWQLPLYALIRIIMPLIVSAIPAVKPTTIGYGINLMTVPRRNMPRSTSITPAMNVAMARPCRPNWAIMLYTITMKAPVGPPI